jgi:hypothetical protein
MFWWCSSARPRNASFRIRFVSNRGRSFEPERANDP